MIGNEILPNSQLASVWGTGKNGGTCAPNWRLESLIMNHVFTTDFIVIYSSYFIMFLWHQGSSSNQFHLLHYESTQPQSSISGPPPFGIRHVAVWEKAFSVMAPKNLWEVHLSPSVVVFCQQVKTSVKVLPLQIWQIAFSHVTGVSPTSLPRPQEWRKLCHLPFFFSQDHNTWHTKSVSFFFPWPILGTK